MNSLRRLGYLSARRAAFGVAALTMVMVLFFIMAMVAAYTNRNLLYEQRMSINSFRATAAMSAADAGIDWAIAMLGGARVDADCVAPVAPVAADIDFRSRYTILQADGSYTIPKWGPLLDRVFTPSCVLTNAGWSCKCPDLAGPLPTLAYPSKSAPIFAVEITATGAPGVLRVDAFGSHESSRAMSFGMFGNYNRLRVNLGLARALPVPPVAALTAGNAIAMVPPATALRVSNADPKTGVTVHAGNAITATNTLLLGPAGSVSTTSVPPDAALLGLSTEAAPLATTFQPTTFPSWHLFLTLFGMDAVTFSRQPAATFVDCTGGCTSASIATVVANNPGRIVWIEGNIDLDNAGTLGTATQPLMMVASGDITLSAQVAINGFLYGRDILWQASAAGSVVRGAMVASRDFQGASAVSVAYDADIIQRISLSYGSFVRVPGSWQVVPTR